MSDENEQLNEAKLRELAQLRIVLNVPNMADIVARKDVTYESDTGPLGMDIYYPPDARADQSQPAVIFVAGYADAAIQNLMGMTLKDMGAYVSWGQLVAASGMVAVTYASEQPERDGLAVLQHLRQNADSLNIDGDQIGIWSTSGNGPTGLSVIMAPDADVRFAVLCNAYMLDLDGESTIADMSKSIGFAAPNAGKVIADVPRNVPLFIVRSGQDEVPGLNGTIDRFVSGSLAEDLPLTVVNLVDAQHGFDINHDSEESRVVIRHIVDFMRLHFGLGSQDWSS